MAYPESAAAGQVQLCIDGPVAHVGLSHPGKFNAMTRAMWRSLRAVFEALPANPALRCVLLRGEGGHFCAGGDISEYPAFRFDVASLRQFHEGEVWGALNAILQCDLPVVAHIEGHCMGAGLEIASCCDLRFATPHTQLGAPIAKLGFPMAPLEAALLVQQLGPHWVRQMLLEAAVLPAQALQASGFFAALAQPEELGDVVQRRVQRLVALSPQAAHLNKQTLRQLNPLPSGMDAGEAAIPLIANLSPNCYNYAPSAEHREGIAAFLDKRAPEF